MTTSKKSSRRWAIVLVISAVILLAITWHFAGYERDEVISLSRVYPLALTSDGATLIVGSEGEYHNVLNPHIVGPIRFLDLATGKDTQPPLALNEVKDTGKHTMISFAKYTKIFFAKLSDDDQRLVVVENAGSMDMYFLTVFDLSTRAVILKKTIPLTGGNNDNDNPVLQLSHDGRLLACSSSHRENGWHWDASVIVWDLNENKERFRLPDRCQSGSFQFSPDGKLLAWFSCGGGKLQLSDTSTGAVVHSISDGNVSICVPAFSPDGRFVAVDDWWGQNILVFDIASSTRCAQVKGVYPQFLPGGTLLGVRGSSEIVAWSSDGWSERRTFPCDLAETIGGIVPGRMRTVMWPTGRPNEFAVNYITSSGSWKRWGQTQKTAAGLYVPEGMCLDLIDAATGSTRYYDLGAYAWRWFPFPQAGKILMPQRDGTTDVWSIPPKRTYRAVLLMAGFLPVIAVLGYGLIFVVRRVVKRYRGRPQTGATP